MQRRRTGQAPFPGLEGADFIEGLLQTPRFVPGARWISALARSANGPDRAGRALPDGPQSAAARARAAALGKRLLAERLGGACWAGAPANLRGAQLAVVLGGGGEAVLSRMVEAALASGPAASVLLALPAGVAGRNAARRVAAAGGQVLRGPFDPWALLDRAATVHAADGDDTALLALLAGIQVRCHAPNWLAGWGLTEDAASMPARGAARGLDDLLAALLLDATRYRDPFTDRPASCEQAIDLAAEWRRLNDANRRVGAMVGMSSWKRRRMARFFHDGTAPPPFHRTGTSALAAAGERAVAAWSSRIPPDLFVPGARVARVEDGFVRSVGLGCDFLPPCSVVVDFEGIYLDPARPSGLERILAETDFTGALLDRARRFVDRLVAHGISKYGAAGGAAYDPGAPPNRRRILVPGQVADDLSVRLGGAGTHGNLDLLRRVRAANPDAFLIYKPHPDVDAGHRRGAIPDREALALADRIARGVPMPALIDAADELHTITSLAGFEAMLRGVPVTCYGQPFYAGWGLTHDMAPIARRRRRLTIEQLAAGALLLYPRYLDPVTELPCPAEVLLDRLADPALSRRLKRGSWLSRARWLQGRTRRRLLDWMPRPAGAAMPASVPLPAGGEPF